MKQRIPTAIALCAIAGALASAGAAPAAGQSPAIFTPEQAVAGRATFTKACASCHLADLSGNDDAPPLAGAPFRDIWKSRTTKELLDYMAGAMPPGGSTLAAEGYAALVAYILERNGAAAGTAVLTPETAVAIGSVIE